jgi:hypothetical protein
MKKMLKETVRRTQKGAAVTLNPVKVRQVIQLYLKEESTEEEEVDLGDKCEEVMNREDRRIWKKRRECTSSNAVEFHRILHRFNM